MHQNRVKMNINSLKNKQINLLTNVLPLLIKKNVKVNDMSNQNKYVKINLSEITLDKYEEIFNDKSNTFKNYNVITLSNDYMLNTNVVSNVIANTNQNNKNFVNDKSNTFNFINVMYICNKICYLNDLINTKELYIK
jgi:hypothetical protein